MGSNTSGTRMQMRAAIVAAIYGIGLLTWSVWRIAADAWPRLQAARVSAAIAEADIWSTPFRGDATLFALGLVAVHAGLALLIWLWSRLAMIAFPSTQKRPALVAATIGAFTTLWILVANAAWFPRSMWGLSIGGVLIDLGTGITVYHVLTVVIAVAAAVTLIQVIRAPGRFRAVRTRIAVYSLVAMVGVWLWGLRQSVAEADSSPHAQPNVIVIGLDSLRADIVGLGQRVAITPHLDRFVSEATVFSDATTPLARTFPAWISILTGTHPVHTRVRENLQNPDTLNIPPTLANALGSRGYRTIYATDEVRFSNIDTRFGFDEIVSPRMGASDFLLTPLSDAPLLNVLANTAVGRWLFPNSYGNRAAAVTYEPDTFIEALDRRLDFDEPTLLAVHLTLPHWPYHWADAGKALFDDTSAQAYAYSNAVVAVDRQFDALMDMLTRKGALGNAVVIVLSDHGEGLALPGDNLLISKSAKQKVGNLGVQMMGHGNSVFSPHQYAVLLGFRAYGGIASGFKAGGRVVDTPATLEDILPTTLDVLGLPDKVARDGTSMAPTLRGEPDSDETLARLRFTETGITVGFTQDGNVDMKRLLEGNLRAYTVNPTSSRIELRNEYVDILMRAKERAVLSRDRILAAIPEPDGAGHRYIAVARTGGEPTLISGEAELAADPGLAAMWAALHERFDGEL